MSQNDILNFEIIYAIVDVGKGSKLLKKAKDFGLSGGTVFIGKGTISNPILNFFALYEERKEVVLIATSAKKAKATMQDLNEYFEFSKPRHGIIFSTKAISLVGSSSLSGNETSNEEEEDNIMYQLITTIVDRGKAEAVMDSALKAGAKGGTIVNARGSGLHETAKLFNMDIEPEKEIVLILSKTDITELVLNNIRKDLSIDEAGKGIIFLQDVARAYGLYE